MNIQLGLNESLTVNTGNNNIVTVPDGTGTLYIKPTDGIPESDLADGVIPTISTSINDDASSNVKTASPKAVKIYVDNTVILSYTHLVFLNLDGTVDQYASTIVYDNIKNNLTDPKKNDYLDVIWNTTRFYAKAIEITDINTGDIKFIGDVEYNGIHRNIVFTLDDNDTLTTTSLITYEDVNNKSQNVLIDTGSTSKYPSIRAIEDFIKPVIIWESNTPANYLKASTQQDISASPTWNLTNLDLSLYKRIKIYSCAERKSSGVGVDASTTPAIVLEMSLDSRNAISSYGGNYVASVVVQKPNDANRLATLTCAVSADKTSFAVLRQTSLYGTGATSNDDANANVFLIEGYYW